MSGIVWAVASGLAVFVWLQRWPWWPLACGWDLGLVTRDSIAMVSGLAMGFGFAGYQLAQKYEKTRDHDEQEALMFVERLGQLLRVRGTLSAALDEMGFRTDWHGSDAGERILLGVADRRQVAALTTVSRMAHVLRRYGGTLDPVLEWASAAIHEGQTRRYGRQMDEAARRATILVLALAPVAVTAIFGAFIPSFYRTLMQTAVGGAAIGATGLVTGGVWLVMAYQIRKEARTR